MRRVPGAVALAYPLAFSLGMIHDAQAEIAANVGLTTNYLWRGETRSQDDAAVSGGIDYYHERGFYLGLWTSSLGGDSDYEADLYAGYRFRISPLSLDVGYINYEYPKNKLYNPATDRFQDTENDTDFAEAYLGFGYRLFTAKYFYSDDYRGSGEEAHYIQGDLDYPLRDDLRLGIHYGWKESEAYDDGFADFHISLNKDDFTFLVGDTDNEEVPQTDNMRMAISWIHRLKL